ncbi:hypothetical protein ACW14Y_42050 (plasmid) [Kitasatospora sp. cg17-2]
MARVIDYGTPRLGCKPPIPRATAAHLEVGDVLAYDGPKTITAIERIDHTDLNPDHMRPMLDYQGWDAYRMTLDDGTVHDVPAFLYFFLSNLGAKDYRRT